ncbi:glycosyltransferase involved in cell wall biosynthesis [Georgenia soli]|uniref:D-inositol 3-phosphate glycosyltransferase n=1 Tax=Georgenia soli TaxID=638953 RepID=A0A2A9EIE9_9MICO|nr:glycosyltransferase family 4 protein [Georgenia soli]PFG38704.1 glycosyltransferase involved in cell wall biosynthesis [Georgenia soli]
MADGRRGRPRVVLATRIFAPEVAAASFRLRALCEALARGGADVTVLTVRAPGPDAGPPGVRVRRWPVLRDRSGYVRGYLQYLSFDVPLLLRLLLAPRPDVVVCEPPPTTGAVVRAVCALRRVPYVYYAADLWADAAEAARMPAPAVRVLRVVEQLALHGARRVIAVSDGVRERLAALGVHNATTVRNGVDTSVFTPEGPSAAETEQPTIVYAGTTSEWQGADVFVRAMPAVLEQVPDARLVFLGQGSAWPAIADLAAALPRGAVEMRGLVPPAEAARWQRGAAAAAVSIVPGQGYDFAYPTKIYAALACGTPVIFAGTGPAADDIRAHDLGWAVDHDVEAVAAAMVSALRAEPADAGRLAAWVEEHASAAAAGRAAADVVLAASD